MDSSSRAACPVEPPPLLSSGSQQPSSPSFSSPHQPPARSTSRRCDLICWIRIQRQPATQPPTLPPQLSFRSESRHYLRPIAAWSSSAPSCSRPRATPLESATAGVAPFLRPHPPGRNPKAAAAKPWNLSAAKNHRNYSVPYLDDPLRDRVRRAPRLKLPPASLQSSGSSSGGGCRHYLDPCLDSPPPAQPRRPAPGSATSSDRRSHLRPPLTGSLLPCFPCSEQQGAMALVDRTLLGRFPPLPDTALRLLYRPLLLASLPPNGPRPRVSSPQAPFLLFFFTCWASQIRPVYVFF
ncbi:neural Wiskott-Aldrich syndrome protein-like [Triticum dicoccoides]|uniref:neural Wiskott-Aldrich syndrome protein-like n=1 Tax=Triticum dicoccoides TaxID=85692 RepID=UPI00188E63C5|nr:neural Wiskott-Aldrich syndrome protein-like [Triticum dicoccoides]